MTAEMNRDGGDREFWNGLFSSILICPSCKGRGLRMNNGESIKCDICGVGYKYKGGIPQLYSKSFSDRIETLEKQDGARADIKDAVMKANIEFHAENSEKYDEDIAIEHLLSESGKMLVRECIQYCKARTGGRVWMDAGCGTGQILSIAEEHKFPVTFGFDLSYGMGTIARRKGHRVFLGEAGNIPAADNSIDLVSASALLHHLTDPESFLRDAFRVLKPGGMLFTDFDPNNRDSYNRPVTRFLRNIWRTFGPKAKSVHTKDERTERQSRLADYQMYYNNSFNGEYVSGVMAGIGFEKIRVEYYFNKAGLDKRDRPGLFQLFRGMALAGPLRMLIKKEIAPFFLVLASKPDSSTSP